MAQVNPALQNQHRAAEQMKQNLLDASTREVQPEVRPSLDAATQALAAYQEQLVELHRIDAQDPTPETEQLRQQVWEEAQVQMQTIQRSQAEISTLMGRSQVMETAMVKLEGAHAQIAPERSPAQTKGQTQTIQEKMYGYKVEHDANGRPVLPQIGDDRELVQTVGLGVELGVEQQAEHEGAGMEMSRDS